MENGNRKHNVAWESAYMQLATILTCFTLKYVVCQLASLKVYAVSTFVMHPDTAGKDTEAFFCCDY